MSGRTELLAYLTTSVGTVVALFALQQIYRTHLDVAYHDSFAELPMNADLAALRAEEAQKLGGLAAAEKALADRGRGASAKIAPKQSEDLSAMNGWIHRPGFAPYTPRKPEPVTQLQPATAPEAPAAEPAEAPAPVEAPPTREGVVLPAAPAAGEGAAAAATAHGGPVPPKKTVQGVTVEASGQVPAPKKVAPGALAPRGGAVPMKVAPEPTAPAGR